MVFGATGQHTLLTDSQTTFVRGVAKRTVLRKPGNKLVSGMAFGVDTEVVLAVWGLMPFADIICVVPGTAPHNYGLVERCAHAGAEIIVCDTLHTLAETYLNRNDEMVKIIRTLMAFPTRPVFYRSGTWATINRARKAGRKVRMYPLAGV